MVGLDEERDRKLAARRVAEASVTKVFANHKWRVVIAASSKDWDLSNQMAVYMVPDDLGPDRNTDAQKMTEAHELVTAIIGAAFEEFDKLRPADVGGD